MFIRDVVIQDNEKLSHLLQYCSYKWDVFCLRGHVAGFHTNTAAWATIQKAGHAAQISDLSCYVIG